MGNINKGKIICQGKNVEFTYSEHPDESAFWEPAAEAIAKLSITEPCEIAITSDDGTAVLSAAPAEDGKNTSFCIAQDGLHLKHSCYQTTKLRKIDPATGVHAMYDLIPNNMGKMTLDVGARYGETGGTSTGADVLENAYVLRHPMPSQMYWIKYYQLLARGYRDFSDVMTDSDADEELLNQYFGSAGNEEGVMTEEESPALILNERLDDAAKDSLNEIINVDFLSSKPPFTKKQVSGAWKLWKKFAEAKGADEMNAIIKDLIAVTDISFKEGRGKRTVDSFMVKPSDDPEELKKNIAEVVDKWEAVIRAMEAVILVPAREKSASVSPFGNIAVEYASEEEKERILKLFNADKGLEYTIYKITPYDFDKRFDEYCKTNNITDIREFCHGSRNSNWKSIIMNGLLLNPNAPITGKAYGYGIYTARDFHKSFGYSSFHGTRWAGGTDDTGYVGIYRAAYGKPYFPNGVGDYEKEVRAGGFNCLDAVARYSGFMMDEIVFYEEAALTLEYLVEFHSKQ